MPLNIVMMVEGSVMVHVTVARIMTGMVLVARTMTGMGPVVKGMVPVMGRPMAPLVLHMMATVRITIAVTGNHPVA